jgi:translation initiation factor 2 subunit 1
MLQTKKGYPEDNELVMCTVTKIYPNSVFVTLDEYQKSGMIHISEVSPGRIRNIREFIKEGKVVVCKVLKVNLERGHIDLSLRRVNEGEKRRKVNEVKQEQKAEKIIEYVSQKVGKDPIAFYNEITPAILKQYPTIHSAFEAVVQKETTLDQLGIAKKDAPILEEVIHSRIKPPQVFIGGELTVTTYASNGVELIKEGIKQFEQEGVHVSYLGGGRWQIELTAEDYKEAEEHLDKMLAESTTYFEKNKVVANFQRKEKK